MTTSEASLQNVIKKGEENEVPVASFDQRLPEIKQIGSSKEEILKHVLGATGNITIYPTQHSKRTHEITQKLVYLLQNLSRNGLAYIADNLSVSANLSKPKPEPQPEDVLLDVCLLVQGLPPTVFTLVKDTSQVVDKARSYNLTLAQGVIKSVRRLTTEHFSAIYGLFYEKDLTDFEVFQRSLHALQEQSLKLHIPDSITMRKDKYKDIVHAFLSSVALTSSVANDDNSDTLWFLTLEQFCILTENISNQEVTVRTAPSSGGKVLMREVAKRLERSGPTLLVMESEEQIQVARDQKTCSVTLTLKEWAVKLQNKNYSAEITNMVTSCKDCPPLPGLRGKLWTFSTVLNSDGQQTQDGLKDEVQDYVCDSSLDLHADIKERIETLECEIIDRDATIKKLKEDSDAMILKLKEDKDATIQNLREEIAGLRQEHEDLSRHLETTSFGGMSADSGRGSDASSVTSLRSIGLPEKKGVVASIRRKLSLGKSKAKVSIGNEIPVYMYVLYNEDKTLPITLACREQDMDRERVNTECCHVTEDGHLINSPPKSPTSKRGIRRFKQYWGTSSVYPIRSHHSPSTSTLSPVQYWETETEVEVKQGDVWLTFLEFGIAEEDQLDADMMIYDSSRSWCLRVGPCNEVDHQGYCTQVWNQNRHVKCARNTLTNTQATTQTLSYGIVLDTLRDRIGFVDVKRGVVLEMMDAELRQTSYLVFGVGQIQDQASVQTKLLSGSGIQMTEEKQKLIYSCLM